jgi:7-cyano-7-deazaguanine synthase
MTGAVKNRTAVALLSGGLDSSIAVALARRQNVDISLALHFSYSHRAAAAEFRQAKKIAETFQIPFRHVELRWFKDFSRGGKLLSSETLPHPTESELSESKCSQKSARAVWVPNRNGVFLEIAAGIAEDEGAGEIIVGFNAEEAATFPDNSQAYVTALNHALRFSTANAVTITSPTLTMNKTEIVRTGVDLDFDWALLWSCYEDGNIMCGRCESCMRLKRAFHHHRRTPENLFEYPNLH